MCCSAKRLGATRGAKGITPDKTKVNEDKAAEVCFSVSASVPLSLCLSLFRLGTHPRSPINDGKTQEQRQRER